MHFTLGHVTLVFLCLGAGACGARHFEAPPASAPEAPSPAVAVAPQYDTSHVYVAPADVDPASDERSAPGVEIGRPSETYRRRAVRERGARSGHVTVHRRLRGRSALRAGPLSPVHES
jgi:hypothetical protein